MEEPRQGIERQEHQNQTRRLFAFAELSSDIIFPLLLLLIMMMMMFVVVANEEDDEVEWEYLVHLGE